MAIKPHDSKNPSWKILLLSSEPRKRTIYGARNLDSSSLTDEGPNVTTLWICLFTHKTRFLNQAMSEGPSSLTFQSPISDPIGNLHLHINCHLVHFQKQRLARRLVAVICSNLLILSEAKSTSSGPSLMVGSALSGTFLNKSQEGVPWLTAWHFQVPHCFPPIWNPIHFSFSFSFVEGSVSPGSNPL